MMGCGYHAYVLHHAGVVYGVRSGGLGENIPELGHQLPWLRSDMGSWLLILY